MNPVRAQCYRCMKAQSMCICASVDVVDNRTPVVIVQHTRERAHAIGTVRIAKRGLRNIKVVVGGPDSFG